MPIRIYHRTIKVLSKKQQYLFFSNTFWGLFINLLDISTISVLLYSLNYVYQLQINGNNPFVVEWLFTMTHNNKQLYSVIILSFVFILLLVKNAIALLIYKQQLHFISTVASGFAEKKLSSYFLQSFSNHIETTTGEQIRNTGNLSIEFAQHLVLGFINIISDIVFLLIAIVAMFIYSPTLFALLSLALIPCFFIIQLVPKNKLHNIRKNIKKEHAIGLQYLIEAINSYVETKIYRSETFFINRFSKQQKNINNNLSDLLFTQALPNRIFEVFIVLSTIVFFMYQQNAHQLNSSNLISTGIFITASLKVVNAFTKVFTNISKAKTYSFTLTELEKIQVPNFTTPSVVDIQLKKSIQLKNISHFFTEGKTILNNVHIQFNVGKITGIHGASGCGKSTLLNILNGLIPFQQGNIIVDNVPLDLNTQLQSWQQQIAFVKQSFFLLEGSIATNIALSENLFDMNKLKEAIEQSGLSSFVEQQANGVHTLLKDNGKNISGGEKQRIAIARALYHNRNLLILDESLNELDIETIQIIIRQLKQIAASGKCIIIVSHQPHVLKQCDYLYHLSNGSVYETNLYQLAN